jgi:site-specific recombinase XerD
LGIHVGTPLLLRPDASIDPRLGAFLRRSRFARRSPGTQWAYVLDYRLFFSFLWARGKDWDEATGDDVYDWEHWRPRDTANRGRIGGAKWAREVAALRLLYEWAVDRDHIAKSPIITRDVRVHDGRTVQVAAIAPRDVVRSLVKWLTRRAYRRWLDIGMRGYDQSNTPDESWHGRHDGRNAAFTDVLFSTGLRLRKAGGLPVTDLPVTDDEGKRYLPMLVPSALAEGRGRFAFLPRVTLTSVTAYLQTTRAQAVIRARCEGRYENRRDVVVVTDTTRGGGQRLQLVNPDGGATLVDADRLTIEDRRRLLLTTPARLEPLSLWLGDSGLPMDDRSFQRSFAIANTRCAKTRRADPLHSAHVAALLRAAHVGVVAARVLPSPRSDTAGAPVLPRGLRGRVVPGPGPVGAQQR